MIALKEFVRSVELSIKSMRCRLTLATTLRIEEVDSSAPRC